MQATNNLSKVSTKSLKSFNQTRLFLHVSHLSQICDEDGLKIRPEYWNATQPAPSTLDWQFQPKPTPKAIQTWQQILTKRFLPKHKGRPTLIQPQLQQPLGPWLPSASPTTKHN